MTQLTDQEYVNKGGGCCPYCQSANIEGDSIDIDANIAWQEVRCLDCEQIWHDVYKLIGYEEIR